MANICTVRIDARLIHGQVATKWIKILDTNRVVIIDDETAADPFLVDLFTLAAPAGVRVNIYTLDQAIERYNKDEFGKGRALVLFKNVETAVAAWSKGFHFISLCLGQVPGGENRRIAYKTVNLSDNELNMLKGLRDKNVKVFFQMVPDETEGSFDSIYKKMMG
jgi:D-glucosaminate PTS system EIIB component